MARQTIGTLFVALLLSLLLVGAAIVTAGPGQSKPHPTNDWP